MTSGSEGSVEKAAMEALEDALDLPSADRRQYLENREDLPEEVRKLAIGLVDSDGRSIRTGGAGGIFADEDGPPPDLPGYRVLSLLGRGGMGAVWLAERSSRDFEHRVAIKVIKPGVFLDTMIDRFRRERQILARLNHPNIAHLHDGGETAAGQPYIVMEYVAGRTLRDWLQEESPDLDQRLDLFVQIAGAVEFAHQNLVIHRDLTPGNVLVTAEGKAKLIDFGIARPQVEEGEVQPASRLTGLSLTPGFAAPERAEGIVSNTLTDIFSLGRILAFMLGKPAPPELQAIADKAAAAEPTERFPSVGELLDEIGNYRKGLPVATYAESTQYRLRKFVQREKTLVSVVAVALVGLLLAFAATLWAYNRAEESRAEAEQRFDELRDLAHFQLFDLYDELDNVVGNTHARVELAQRAQDYLVVLANSRSGDVDLQLDTANGFVRLARIQGIPAHPNFGEPDLARENLERAEQLFAPLVARGVPAASTGMARLEAYRALLLAHGESKVDEAWEAIERAQAALDRVPANARDIDWHEARRNVHGATLEWADLQLDSAVMTDHIALMERDMAEWPVEMRAGYPGRTDRARMDYYRAIVEMNKDSEEDYRRSLQLYLRADEQFAALEEDFPNDPQTLYWRAWNAYYGHAVAATIVDDAMTDRLLRQARESVQRLMAVEEADNSLSSFADRLGEAQAQFLANAGRFEEAIATMQEVMDVRQMKLDRSHSLNNIRDVAFGNAIFGTIHRQAGNRQQACDHWARAERQMAELEAGDALQGFVEALRAPMNENLDKCRRGLPVTSFGPLDGQG